MQNNPGLDVMMYAYLNMALIVIAAIAVIWLYIRLMKYLKLKIEYLKKKMDSE